MMLLEEQMPPVLYTYVPLLKAILEFPAGMLPQPARQHII